MDNVFKEKKKSKIKVYVELKSDKERVKCFKGDKNLDIIKKFNLVYWILILVMKYFVNWFFYYNK